MNGASRFTNWLLAITSFGVFGVLTLWIVYSQPAPGWLRVVITICSIPAFIVSYYFARKALEPRSPVQGDEGPAD